MKSCSLALTSASNAALVVATFLAALHLLEKLIEVRLVELVLVLAASLVVSAGLQRLTVTGVLGLASFLVLLVAIGHAAAARGARSRRALDARDAIFDQPELRQRCRDGDDAGEERDSDDGTRHAGTLLLNDAVHDEPPSQRARGDAQVETSDRRMADRGLPKSMGQKSTPSAGGGDR